MIVFSDDEARHRVDAIEDEIELLFIQRQSAMDEVSRIDGLIVEAAGRRRKLETEAIENGGARYVNEARNQ